MKLSDLTCCPYCGSEVFYTKANFSGPVIWRERFDGKEEDNSSMYDCLKQVSNGNKVYCDECDRLLGYKSDDKLTREAENAAMKESEKDG